eukprot:TRINITY_DN6099_c0_g1_i1.p1 TRINITY_DN6099_c0_g1~~TRINITY_DN6099_c0_g1_i1.p1  ORF type:complete len:405 (+),score=96.10 TRINITY_DN6099_c0_g1_i1:124-1338(+)
MPLTVNAPDQIIKLDVSVSNGFQAIKNCLACAGLLGKSIIIAHIAEKPSPPPSLHFSISPSHPSESTQLSIQKRAKSAGIRAHQVAGLNLLREIYRADIYGAIVGSKEIKFKPNKMKSGSYVLDCFPAASIVLEAQSIIPCLLFGGSHSFVHIRGGSSDVAECPPYDYFTTVFTDILKRMGVQVNSRLIQRGFYPKGGSVLELTVDPITQIRPLVMTERGNLISLHVKTICAGGMSTPVAQKMVSGARQLLSQYFSQVEIIEEHHQEQFSAHTDDFASVQITGKTCKGCILSGNGVAKLGGNYEKVGNEAALSLVNDFLTGACLDQYLQDQIVLYLALAEGTSVIRTGPMSVYMREAMRITSTLFGAKFYVQEQNESPTEESYIITCNGIGLRNEIPSCGIASS